MKLLRFFGILIPAAFVLAFSAGAVHAQTAGAEIWFGPASRYSTPDEPRPRGVDLLINRLGIMYNGGGPFDKTDANWGQAARDHMATVEQNFRPRPDIIAFFSWEDYPSHAMPDDPSQDTMTGLVSYYFSHYRTGPSGQ
jgi:hypothetical protein